MKTIDKMILKGFIAPYILAFLVAEFVLIMQFLWKYIDDIIGKGVSVGVIFELIFYFGVTIIPMAIPISLLISSVMVFGDLSEKHELSSFKSAGVSLLRIMRGGIILALATAGFSFFASNYLKPNANYQYFYRMNSIQKQKPAMSIEEGVFNSDFKDFVIRVGEKADNERNISDVLIYDHSSTNNNLLNIVSANEGEMYGSEDGSYFIMKLTDGEQIREDKSEYNKEKKSRSYPLVRTKFKEWTKIFDLTQFEMAAIDINTDRKKYDLLNSWQLKSEIDSFDRKILNIQTTDYLPFDRIFNPDKKRNETDSRILAGIKNKSKKEDKVDSSKKKDLSKEERKELEEKITKVIEQKGIDNNIVETNLSDKLKVSSKSTKPTKSPETFESIFEYYGQSGRRYTNASHTTAIRKKEMYATAHRKLTGTERLKRVYQLRLNQQFSWALICIIFFFIGAPLGSIIRKGGYGYPLLIAIIFFMIFIIMNIMGEKLNKSEAIHPVLAAWLPCLVLVPFSIFLTYKAVIDAKLQNMSFPFKSFLKRKKAA